MNRNETRVMNALKQGYKIYRVPGKYLLQKEVTFQVWQPWDGCNHPVTKIHTLSGVSDRTVQWLHNHYFIKYKMGPEAYYEWNCTFAEILHLSQL